MHLCAELIKFTPSHSYTEDPAIEDAKKKFGAIISVLSYSLLNTILSEALESLPPAGPFFTYSFSLYNPKLTFTISYRPVPTLLPVSEAHSGLQGKRYPPPAPLQKYVLGARARLEAKHTTMGFAT